MSRTSLWTLILATATSITCPARANVESLLVMKHFPRWVKCNAGSAEWKQTAPGFQSNLAHSAAFELTVHLPDGTQKTEPATGHQGVVRSWNYSVSWSTGGFTLSGEKEGVICYSHKLDGASAGFEMGGFPKGASFRYRDKDGKTVDVNY